MSSLDKYNGVIEVIQKVEESKKLLARASVNTIQEALVEDGINFVGVIGYTPSFNDGDPCEHTSEVFLQPQEMEDNYGQDFIDLLLRCVGREDLDEEIDEEDLFKSLGLNQIEIDRYGSKESRERWRLIEQAIQASIGTSLESEYKTNFMSVMVYHEGTWKTATTDLYVD